MQWSTAHSAWFFLALAAALAAMLWMARRAATSPTARGWGLFLLRSAVLAALLVLLANPVHVSESRLPPRLPGAMFLFDSSRSMGLESPVSRHQQVEQAVADALRRLPNPHDVRISRFQFGEQLLPLTGAAQPTGDHSRLSDALESLPARFGEDLPLGVFVFSDGRSTEEVDAAAMQAMAEGYKQLGVPVHVFPVGDPGTIGDVAIRDVVAPRDAPPGTKVPLKVVVGSVGRKGDRAEIVVRSASAPQGPALATLPITLTDADATFDLTVDADAAQGRLRIEVPPAPHEAFVQNNQVDFPLAARNPKIRVIYMEGTLNNEYTFIRDALVEDPNIECLAIEVNAQYAQTPTLHRVNEPARGFPTTREELFEYDVIICSDINRSSFNQDQLNWVVELVGERGGGFVMIGGNTSFGAGNWDQTVWDGLIPVDMAGRQRGYGTLWNVVFRANIPPESLSHPVWRIVDDEQQNRQVLASMPVFYGTNRTDRLKSGATVLAYSDQPLADAGVIPILTCQTFGKGRTFAFSPDSTSDWGRDFERLWGEGDNRYFRKFWRNVVRWLAEGSAGRNRRLRIETDKLMYRPGESIRLTAQAFDEQQKPTGQYRVTAKLRTPAPASQRPGDPPPRELSTEESLAPRPADQVYEGRIETPAVQLVPLPTGQSTAASRTVTVELTALQGNQTVAQGTADIQILDDSPEFRDPRPDPGLLTELAEQTGGRVMTSGADIASVLSTYKSVPGDSAVFKVPLWDRLWVWLAIVVLLTVEWIVRRASGLA